MNIILSKKTYDGVDGSSLSQTRCEQTIELFEIVKSMPQSTYKELQKYTADNKIFASESVMRTFCPLLKKLDFVNYDDIFQFTQEGGYFVQILKAIENAKKLEANHPHQQAIMSKLLQAKINSIRVGLIHMYKEYPNHNIWHVLRMLSMMSEFYWSEYCFSLKCVVEDRMSYKETVSLLNKNRENNVEVFAIGENGNPLPDTTYTYMRALLNEADLINSPDNYRASLNYNGKQFVKNLGL